MFLILKMYSQLLLYCMTHSTTCMSGSGLGERYSENKDITQWAEPAVLAVNVTLQPPQGEAELTCCMYSV